MHIILNKMKTKDNDNIYLDMYMGNDAVIMKTYTEDEMRTICKYCEREMESINAIYSPTSKSILVRFLYNCTNEILDSYKPFVIRVPIKPNSMWCILTAALKGEAKVKGEKGELIPLENISVDRLSSSVKIENTTYICRTDSILSLFFKNKEMAISLFVDIKDSVEFVKSGNFTRVDINLSNISLSGKESERNYLPANQETIKKVLDDFYNEYSDILMGVDLSVCSMWPSLKENSKVNEEVLKLLPSIPVPEDKFIDIIQQNEELISKFYNVTSFSYGISLSSNLRLVRDRLTSPQENSLYKQLRREQILVKFYKEFIGV